MTTVIAEWSGPYQSAMTTVIAGGYAVGVDAGQEPSRTPASSEQPSARERIVRSAAALVRERGVHGVGLRQIVTHADGPRGSLQRYFPGGKTQLITEALKLVGAEVLGETESRLVEATTLADAIDAIFAPWHRVLAESHFTMGCPIAATVIDASGDDELRREARDLLDQWRDAVHAVLVTYGVQESTAQDDASVLLAALEGALILSRANQSTEPLETVQRFFTTSLTQLQPTPPLACDSRVHGTGGSLPQPKPSPRRWAQRRVLPRAMRPRRRPPRRTCTARCIASTTGATIAANLVALRKSTGVRRSALDPLVAPASACLRQCWFCLKAVAPAPYRQPRVRSCVP